MKALSYKQEEIGKFIKATKVKHMWQFEFGKDAHSLVLKVSKLSGNYEVELDNRTLYKGNNINESRSFQFDFKIQGHSFKVVQVRETFDVLYEGLGFKHYLNDQGRRSISNDSRSLYKNDAPDRTRRPTQTNPSPQPVQNFGRNTTMGFMAQNVQRVGIPTDLSYKDLENQNAGPKAFALSADQKFDPSNYQNGRLRPQPFDNLPQQPPSNFFNNQVNSNNQAYSRGGSVNQNTPDTHKTDFFNSNDNHTLPGYPPFYGHNRANMEPRLSIEGTTEYEKRGAYFIEIDFPKGSEHTKEIVNLVHMI